MFSQIKIITIKSKCLDKTMRVAVYLPSNYSENEPFPVLYFHHGRSGNEQFLAQIEMDKIADSLILQGQIKPMLIVCPDMENSRGINSATRTSDIKDPMGRTINLGMYDDYFITEVIPTIDATFSTFDHRDGRYIGGASAGGYMALHCAFRHQNLFSKVGGHMPAIELQLEAEDKAYFQNFDNWNKYDPIYLAQNNEIATDIKVWLDAGNEDEGHFYDGCAKLYEILKSKNIDVKNSVPEGHHNVAYIQSNLETYLKFYSNSTLTD